MTRHSVWLELDLGPADQADLVAAAVSWLDEGSRRLAPVARERLDTDPGPPTRWPADPEAPWGPPNGGWGRIHIAREAQGPLTQTRRAPNGKGWNWLARQLADPVFMAAVQLSPLDDKGYPTAGSCYLEVRQSSRTPGWIRLSARTSSFDFLEAEDSSERQDRWLSFLRGYADRLNPAYGQIGILHNNGGNTTLEHLLPPDFGRNTPPRSVADSRELLRGYTWLTIVAEELVQRLGGADALLASGAFAEVSRLRSGGLWLRSTMDYRDFDQKAAERVFRVLAPVLRPGVPSAPPDYQPEPFLAVIADASSPV